MQTAAPSIYVEKKLTDTQRNDEEMSEVQALPERAIDWLLQHTNYTHLG